MKYGINTLDDFDYQGKTVLCRVDINQPVDKKTNTLKSTARIRACIPTLRELSDQGARLVLMAHQGSDIEYKNFYTLQPHSKVLSELLEREVKFIDDVCGPAARQAIATLKDGEILLLDNVRFMSEEQTLFEKNLKLTHEEQAQTQVVQKLAPLADYYVCDAFAAAHRDQPTLCGFEEVLPSAMGRLFEKEYCILSDLLEDTEHPCTFVLGGAKIADAFLIMETVLEDGVADWILTGGVVGNIMLIAKGEEVGTKSRDFIEASGYSEFIELGKKLLEKYGDKILMPLDIAYVSDGNRNEAVIGNMPEDISAVDIGEKTISLYQRKIQDSKTVFMNGPMGIFEEEPSELGTKRIMYAIGDTKAFTVVGGGDSITATTKYGKTEEVSYMCTGGGALIQFLSGKEMPVVTALKHGAEKFKK